MIRYLVKYAVKLFETRIQHHSIQDNIKKKLFCLIGPLESKMGSAADKNFLDLILPQGILEYFLLTDTQFSLPLTNPLFIFQKRILYFNLKRRALSFIT